VATTRVTDLQALTTPDGADVLHAVDVSADRDSKLTITGLQAAIGGAFAPAVHQHNANEIINFNASSRAQTEAALIAGANITLTPAGTGATRTITVASTAAGGGGGTVTQVDGGAGLTGSVTTSGSLAVGAGSGITVAADSVSINRTTTDTWYASAAQGALAATALQPGQAATTAQGAKADTALQPGSVDLGYTAATRTITNTAGDPAVLPLVTSGAAGLAPQSGGGTSNFLRADGTWAAPPAGGGGATNLDGLSDVTITTPATDQVLKFNGTEWVNAAAPGGGGGTVTQVTGGAGLTGSVTTTGALAVGAGTGITVNPDDVAINRTTVDGWYLPRANHTGTQGVSTIQFANSARLLGCPASAGPGQEVTVVAPLFFNAGALNVNPASGAFSGSMSSADFTKLAGIATGATANSTDAQLRDRSTHTGTQAGSTVTGAYTASGLTMSGVGLLGRAAVGGGPAVEITIGTGLLLTGTTLTATATGGGGATDLDGLSDVSILSPASGQIIGFNAGFWRNMTPGNLFLAQSNPTGVTGADAITNMISLTQAEYDAIATKNASTLYVIV
jgi:hypothetical protein